MPKKDVDYSNTIIYKICCKDESITDVYVGHTTNFIQRKYSHKQSCNNVDNTLKIYNVIRYNGGWNNWDMVEIAKYCCKDATEARIKEQQHYNELKACLNSCPPYVDIKNYFCNICNLQCKGPKQYDVHMNSIKHINNFTSIKSLKNPDNYFCECCNYETYSKKDFNKHILTAKHNKLENASNMLADSVNLSSYHNQKFICNCGKLYAHDSSYYRHKNKCTYKDHNISSNIVKEKEEEQTDKELILKILKQNSELIKENSELRKEQSDINSLILEIVKNGTHNTTNTTTHTNSHNKAFNLNFFLNETCKNAMNITDFVDSIKLQLSDFMEVGEVGYIQGISNIIVKKLNALDETIRPIHCTDQKRETFYVKDENKWEKEEEDFNRIRKMIKRVSYKNERLMTSYKEKYPDYNDPQSKRSDHYSKTVIEALGGDGDNYKEKENKIIKNISRATHPKGNNK